MGFGENGSNRKGEAVKDVCVGREGRGPGGEQCAARKRMRASRTRRRTFATAIEFDGDLFVHVLAQVENVLFLGLLRRCCVTTSSTATSARIAPAPR